MIKSQGCEKDKNIEINFPSTCFIRSKFINKPVSENLQFIEFKELK